MTWTPRRKSPCENARHSPSLRQLHPVVYRPFTMGIRPQLQGVESNVCGAPLRETCPQSCGLAFSSEVDPVRVKKARQIKNPEFLTALCVSGGRAPKGRSPVAVKRENSSRKNSSAPL